ncbi:MAG: hypothetical protein RM338_05610 [Nostoc sp. DedQUE12a]|nr:hypothetical protein [Nostoc sp. DedQUE12a]
MNKQLIEKWIDALRSGEYKQARCQLRDGDTFCALGVACDISGMMNWEEYFVNDSSEMMPLDVAAQYGFIAINERLKESLGIPKSYYCPSFQSAVTSLNDEFHLDFDEIADLIEQHLLPLAG